MLEIQNLHVYYGGIHALHGISLSVPAGKIVALLGANGAGKSSTLRTIMGIVKPTQGTIELEGQSLLGMKPFDIVKQGVALVPEGRRVFTNLTVYENLALGAYTRTDREEVRREVAEVYALFPRLEEREKQSAGTLSGGEQQMLATARGLMLNPSLLMLDEPSMGLSPVLVELIFDTIKKLNDQGVTILLVEQNALMALSIAHRGYVLQTGSIVLSDTAENLRKNSMVQHAYLGME